ncbi:MAG: Methylthioribose-phosphate isomerase [Planctomycetota bacterium]
MTSSRPAPLPPTIAWQGGVDGVLLLLDQTALPKHYEVLQVRTLAATIDAIRRLCVRGAPAIGVAAAYGMLVGVRERAPSAADFAKVSHEVGAALIASRPTAVNLAWAVQRALARIAQQPTLDALLDEARAIHAEDEASCRRMGEFGADLIPSGATVLTHCNTGRLATAGDGTALAVVFAAWRAGRRFRVLADETRPLLQGARLTALELAAEGIPVDVCVDGAAAGLIARRQVTLAIVGADRIAANGDFANKVGTYGVALACAAHGVPFYVAAPASTFDPAIDDGAAIPIEERDAKEVTDWADGRLCAAGVGARNPAFDVTPAALVRGFVTDHGLLRPPFGPAIKAMLAACR